MEPQKPEDRSGQQPAEGSDDLPPPTKGSPVRDKSERPAGNEPERKVEKGAPRKADDINPLAPPVNIQAGS